MMPNGKTNGFKGNLQVVENLETGEQKIYNSVFVDPKYIDIIRNDLAMQIVGKLAAAKSCAMDLSRELSQHEQKIYYHIRRLEQAGIIKRAGVERRFGMLAKMYTAVSPIVSAKLYDDGHILKKDLSLKANVLEPFIDKGKLNAEIIAGSPYPHGEYGATARDGAYIADLTLFLGTFLNNVTNVHCKLDTEIKERDLRQNLILIGSPKINTLVGKLNQSLQVYFDESKEWSLVSKTTGKIYSNDAHALISKMQNPYNPEKEILLLAGRRSAGLRSAIIAFINHYDTIMSSAVKGGSLDIVVKGIDKNSDGIVDAVEFIEK